MEYPHWLIVAGAILVVVGVIGLAFRQRLAPVESTETPVEPKENRPVTTTTKGNNQTGKVRPPWEKAAQNKRGDKQPTSTPGLIIGPDLRNVNEEIAEHNEPKTTPQIEKP
jgi:hypothetical protein